MHYFSPLNTFIRLGFGSGAGPIPLTNGSGSRMPKNMRIRLRIRIPNTGISNKSNFSNMFHLNCSSVVTYSITHPKSSKTVELLIWT
jgi:hypothetical protein